jgi:ribonucleoside-diphosphate reductase alpha chain
VPWLKTLDSSVAAVNQGGKRKGAACVYLETWHADIEEFLELRDNTGDEARRTHNLNLANWVPDLFMQRVESRRRLVAVRSASVVPELTDLYGEDFERPTCAGRTAQGKAAHVKARELYARMMRTLAETGNGWMTFKDKSQPRLQPDRRPATCPPVQPVHRDPRGHLQRRDRGVQPRLDQPRPAPRATTAWRVRFRQARRDVRLAVRQLDRVIDLNFYPIEVRAPLQPALAPGGLGCMGLQDVFFKLRLPFDCAEARALSPHRREIYFHALSASCELAEERAAPVVRRDPRRQRASCSSTCLERDVPEDAERWDALRERIASTACATRC